VSDDLAVGDSPQEKAAISSCFDPLIEDFAAKRFAVRPDAALEAYRLLEDYARHASSIPGTSLKSVQEYEKYMELFSQLRDNVEMARNISSVSSNGEAYERLNVALQYLIKDVSLLKAQAGKESEEERGKGVLEMSDFLQQHKDDGVFVAERIRGPRLGGRYGLPK